MKRLRLSLNDALALVALLMLAVGSAIAWPPAGLIVPGALLLVYAVLPDQRPPA